MIAIISSYLKPYLHMNEYGHIRADRDLLVYKFLQLDLWTPSVGLTFGILAFSSSISQLTCVAELVLSQPGEPKLEGNPSRDHFKLPLMISTFLACTLKCIFAIVGSMMFTKDTNLFGDLIFSKEAPDAVIVALAVYSVLIIIP